MIFLPSSAKLRPAQDISKLLSGGPTACEARDELGGNTGTSRLADPSGVFMITVAKESRKPNGSIAIEDIVGAAVPEVAEVKHRVDHGRGVAGLHPARPYPMDIENGIFTKALARIEIVALLFD